MTDEKRRYVIKISGARGVLVTDSYFDAMKEISAALRAGLKVTAERTTANQPTERRA